MSIQPYNSINQTQLVPQTLLGYSSNGVSAIEILPTSITIGGNLLTTPIFVEISATTGLTTTNPTGLDVNCDFNMNSNDITNVDTLSSAIGSNLILDATTEKIIAKSDIIMEDVSNPTWITTIETGGLTFDIAGNYGITLDAEGGASIVCSDSGGGFTSILSPSLLSLNDGTIVNTMTSNGINTNGIFDLTTTSGSININSATDLNITTTTEINFINPTETFFNTTGPYAGDGIVYANFVGNFYGNATSATNSTNSNITDNNTSATYYPVFVSNNIGSLPLNVDKTTNPLSYIPSTGNLTSTLFTGLLSTGGLVYLSTGSVAITGSASATNFNLASIFNSTYKNYRIVLAPTTQLTFSAYPSYSLQAFLGSGTLPTIASLYGFEMTSSASTIVSPVYTAGATISSAPLILAVSQTINHQTIIEVENVGYSATTSQQIGLKCKSFYGNPGISGASDRSIVSSNNNGTITGLTLQQSSISVSNSMTIGYTIYAYK